MSRDKIAESEEPLSRSPHGRRDRFMQPSILMGLYLKPSYGYELIQNIQMFGFVEGQAPPGMIYRHLRQMEEEGLVSSEWETEGTGPAKRIYRLTGDGKDMLAVWIEYMERQVQNLNDLIRQYHEARKEEES